MVIPSQSSLPVYGQHNQLKLGLLGFFGQDFSIQDARPQFEMVTFSEELPELGWVSWFKWALLQGPILHPHNYEAQDTVCPLGLMPIVSSHTSNLWTISYQIQDIQVTAVCLNGAGEALEASLLHGSHCCGSDSVVCA